MLTLAALTVAPAARADFEFAYEGNAFDTVIGSFFVQDVDRVTGTFVFESIGASTPKSFTLNVSSNGGSGFSFVINDFNAPPVGITVDANFTTWTNGLPSVYSLEVQGERNLGNPNLDEVIAIAGDTDPFLSGDGAEIDVNQFQNIGVSSGTGNWTAIPEPGSTFGLLLSACLGICTRRRYRR
ncbi:MAG: PEP-CTERM sorting domain-containing protein [bacterium]|nr:PEP-CTERM sorting domain-containing protein [bacterium]